MEGSWRALAAWLAATLAASALIAGASGCGGDEGSSAVSAKGIPTKDPERTFAPLIEIAADEPWRPMSARWFIDHSVFGLAEDDGCPDRVIAVGRTMPERQSFITDWIYPIALGSKASDNYYRSPYDARCDDKLQYSFYADQLTRPHDPGPRIDGIRPGEGYYLDLDDAARGGPAPGEATATAYVERSDEGGGRVRLTYRMLFGMHAAPGVQAHEGDWERVDVLLQEEADDRYRALAVQVLAVDPTTLDREEEASGEHLRDAAWRATRKVGGTHPVVEAERGTHAMAAVSRGRGCPGCARLETWRSLEKVKAQHWYGFGGSWGEPGASSATTGPLGPHDRWLDADDKRAQIVERAGL